MASNEERIRQRAYEIWEQEGRPHGEDLKQWLQASQEIGASLRADTRRARKSRSKNVAAIQASPKSKDKAKAGGVNQGAPTTPSPPKPTKSPGSATRR